MLALFEFQKGVIDVYYEPPDICTPVFGEIYKCDHPLYDTCTLFKEHGKGLAVIQQRWCNKKSWWDAIDPWLANDIYKNPNFPEYFKHHSSVKDECGFYHTVCVRQIMRSLGMPPLRKEFWETRF